MQTQTRTARAVNTTCAHVICFLSCSVYNIYGLSQSGVKMESFKREVTPPTSFSCFKKDLNWF